jgi:ABC-type nitrate/sulfonate/bicarbonate transport system substrate-binding protein
MRLLKQILSLLFLCLFMSCSPPQKTASIVFMAGYKPQANLPFVGVYVAQEKGFFKDENLDVDIQHTAGRGEHLQLLVAGSVDITTQDAAVLLQRSIDPGLPLVSIGLVGQKGQQAYIALKHKGITSLDDWRAHRIGYKGTPPPDLLALLDIAKLDQHEVELINVGFDPRVLTQGLVDVYPVYNSNEPYLIQSWGYDIIQWEAEDYGIPGMGLAYVSTHDIVETKPALISAFMRASIRGIVYAEEHPEEAIDIVLRYAGPETSREHMAFMLATELTDAHSLITDANGLGWQTREQWQALLDNLIQYGGVSGSIDVDTVFTNQFLPTP